jgi:hypothetical protein
MAGSALQRFGVFGVGAASTGAPKHETVTQRQRFNQRETPSRDGDSPKVGS